MNEKMMNLLFTEWDNTHTDTPECDRAFVKLDANEDGSTRYEVLSDCIYAENKQAFIAGFRTAVSLLMGGVN